MMTIADKLQTIADNTQKVFNAGFLEGQEAGGYNEGFDAGKKAERDAFWDSYQDHGNRTKYNYAFVNFDSDTFYPKYDMKPTQSQYMFGNSNGLQVFMNFDLCERLRECGVVLDTSESEDLNAMFLGTNILTIPTLNLRGETKGCTNLFRNSTTIRSIERLILKDDGSSDIGGSFNYNNALEEIRFEGVLACDINLQWSTKLSKSSIYSILYAADLTIGKDFPRFIVTLSRAAVNKAFETSEGANDGEESWEWTSYINNTESYYTTTLA